MADPPDLSNPRDDDPADAPAAGAYADPQASAHLSHDAARSSHDAARSSHDAARSSHETAPPEHEPENRAFVFPRWANYLLPLLVLGVIGGATYVPTAAFLGLNPDNLNRLYRPEQPVPYSHNLHVAQLGMDCTYCHTTVNDAAFAAVPPTQTCVACHGAEAGGAGLAVKSNSTKLAPVYASVASGKPIEWIKVHDLADYAYFNHSAHVTKGVACVTCHGRIDQMGEEGVYQHSNLSMSWCIECHRAPEEHLRPADQVTSMTWKPIDDPRVKQAVEAGELEEDDERAQQLFVGNLVKKQMQIHNLHYMQACSTCHR